eukprot:gene268-474_t
MAAPWDGQQFNYQLGETFNLATHKLPGVNVYFVDHEETSAATVAAMKAAGLVPICYFSTQYENWRSDASSFPASVLGNNLDGWPGEKWVDIRSPVVQEIMKQRIANCKAKGFVAIDPDNTDGDATRTGFPITLADTLKFLTFLSTEARAQGLGIGLKNTLDVINSTTVALWDFAVNEECYSYNECQRLAPFKNASKAIFNVEYTSATNFANNVCPKAASFGTTSIRKLLNLTSLPRDVCTIGGGSSNTTSNATTSSPACVQQVAVPSYYYPSCLPDAAGCVWQKTKAGAGLSVINPASGPGTAVDANYLQTVNQLKVAKVLLLGYVYTKYGARSEADVKADIDRWRTLYGLTNIFLDEGSSSCDQLAYYQGIVAYIKSATPTAMVALNWGVDGSECYLNS